MLLSRTAGASCGHLGRRCPRQIISSSSPLCTVLMNPGESTTERVDLNQEHVCALLNTMLTAANA